MTVLERKARLVTDILNDTNIDRFIEMERFYKSLAQSESITPSFMCSVDELTDSLSRMEHDFVEGETTGATSGQMRRKQGMGV